MDYSRQEILNGWMNCLIDIQIMLFKWVLKAVIDCLEPLVYMLEYYEVWTRHKLHWTKRDLNLIMSWGDQDRVKKEFDADLEVEEKDIRW